MNLLTKLCELSLESQPPAASVSMDAMTSGLPMVGESGSGYPGRCRAEERWREEKMRKDANRVQ